MQPEIGAVEHPFQYTTGSTISAFETTNVLFTKVPVESVTVVTQDSVESKFSAMFQLSAENLYS